MANKNEEFLSVIDESTKAAILKSVADHYECTPEEAHAEVTDEGAEHLLEYLVEPVRSTTSMLMQQHGLR